MNLCTVTTRRRIPFSAVLAASFLEHHPDGLFTALVCDQIPHEAAQTSFPGHLLTPAEIGLAGKELSRMAMIWPENLLKRALIPELLKFAIEGSSEPVVFFADDSLILGPLDSLQGSAAEAGLLLSLRTAFPLPSDGCTPAPSDLLRAGVHEDGFAGMSASAKDVVEFWRDELGAATLDPEFEVVPQRIQDLLAAHFGHGLAPGSGAAVSFWNVWQDTIRQRGGSLFFGGSPLTSFSFQGFSPEATHLLSQAQGPRPRVLLSERDDLRSLVGDYCDRLMRAGYEKAAKLPYGFESLPSGVKVDKRMRHLFREQVRAFATEQGPLPPDPFDPDESAEFLAWLNSPDEDGPAPAVSRYLFALYRERGDLQAAFPGIARVDARRYLDWVVQYGANEADIPQALCPASGRDAAPAASEEALTVEGPGEGPAASAGEPAQAGGPAGEPIDQAPKPIIPFGVNIVGYFKAELGVGEMGRLVLAGIQQAGIQHATTAYSAFLSRQTHPYKGVGEEFSFDINLFCVNADQLPSVVRDYGHSVLEDRYNIGVWWWEVDVLPSHMAQSAALLDEIWVGSEYVGRAVVKATDKLVRLFPVPIRRIDAMPLDRGALGLPEGFMFLFTFDFLSVFERKNPIAVIGAFQRAFAPHEGPSLVIKTINGDDHLHELEKLRMAACGRPDIKLLDGYLSAQDNDRLLASADCYVSLHRAEGYGLGMAEAMALGKPIIATGYSGNLAFLNDLNSYLVGFRVVPIPRGAGPYPPGANWAEPDVGQAADAMRRVYYDPEAARAIGLKAREEALTVHTLQRTAEFISARLDAIRLERGRHPVAGPG